MLREVSDALEGSTPYRVAGATDELPAIRRLIGRRPLDLVIADSEMARAIDRLGRSSLSDEGPPVLVVAEPSDRIWSAVASLRYCDGLIVAGRHPPDIQRLLELAAERVSAIPNEFAPLLHGDTARRQQLSLLAPIERAVLCRLGSGSSNPAISRELQLPIGSVKAVVRRLLLKLRFQNRTEAAVYAARVNWADLLS